LRTWGVSGTSWGSAGGATQYSSYNDYSNYSSYRYSGSSSCGNRDYTGYEASTIQDNKQAWDFGNDIDSANSTNISNQEERNESGGGNNNILPATLAPLLIKNASKVLPQAASRAGVSGMPGASYIPLKSGTALNTAVSVGSAINVLSAVSLFLFVTTDDPKLDERKRRAQEIKEQEDNGRIPVSHYTSKERLVQILKDGFIKPSPFEGHVFVMKEPSFPKEAKKAGAISVKYRITFLVHPNEIIRDPNNLHVHNAYMFLTKEKVYLHYRLPAVTSYEFLGQTSWTFDDAKWFFNVE
jgi:hypothetical protein